MKVYILDVPFELKDEARKHKCWWDAENKRWEYRNETVYDSDDEVRLFVDTYTRVNLLASFEDKDEIKRHKGRWDPSIKEWYTYRGNEPLKKFMHVDDKEIKKSKKTKKEKVKPQIVAEVDVENKEGPFDENGTCNECGWNSCFSESHMLYGNVSCKYLNSKYKITMDDHGNIFL